MACFKDDFSPEECTTLNVFSSTHWQCFDDFSKISISEQLIETGHITAVKEKGTYDDFTACTDVDCPKGDCVCNDVPLSGATKYCQEKGNFYGIIRKKK